MPFLGGLSLRMHLSRSSRSFACARRLLPGWTLCSPRHAHTEQHVWHPPPVLAVCSCALPSICSIGSSQALVAPPSSMSEPSRTCWPPSSRPLLVATFRVGAYDVHIILELFTVLPGLLSFIAFTSSMMTATRKNLNHVAVVALVVVLAPFIPVYRLQPSPAAQEQSSACCNSLGPGRAAIGVHALAGA